MVPGLRTSGAVPSLRGFLASSSERDVPNLDAEEDLFNEEVHKAPIVEEVALAPAKLGEDVGVALQMEDAGKDKDTVKCDEHPERNGEENGHTDEQVSEGEVNARWERIKAAAAIVLVLVSVTAILLTLRIYRDLYDFPDCDALDAATIASLRSCDVCGRGTLLLPMFSEYEKSWPKGPRAALYLFALLWAFVGMGIVCDQFMAGIEQITAAKRTVWKEVHAGAKHKFCVAVWNDTVANLTLMALGSSAPEILLSVTELMGNKFHSGRIGPATIVGSASFNLLVISAVCVSAIPAGETRKIEGTAAFLVTSTTSLLAYVWLLVITLVITPNKIDVWEGAITLACFPLLVVTAFAADKGWLSREHAVETEPEYNSEEQGRTNESEDSRSSGLSRPRLRKASTICDGDITKAAFRRALTSRITFHAGATARLVQKDARPCVFGFAHSEYHVSKCVGKLQIKVSAIGSLDRIVQLGWYTHLGDAKGPSAYANLQGVLTFSSTVQYRYIEIPLDNTSDKRNELFFVELHDVNALKQSRLSGKDMLMRSATVSSVSPSQVTVAPTSGSCVGFGLQTAKVIVLNETPGALCFDVHEVLVIPPAGGEDHATVTLCVLRTEGSVGLISCEWELLCKDDCDGKPESGKLTFLDGNTYVKFEVSIPVSAAGEYKVRLINPTPGVFFKQSLDGEGEKAVCNILTSEYRSYAEVRSCASALELWCDQVQEMLYCNGSMGDQAQASVVDWLFHLLSLIWKLIFMWTPPVQLAGGWACFLVALIAIGLVTALAGDLASLLACSLGIPDDVSAITLVALGTSLPDTFASRFAAMQNDSADSAIGNITGSNSVNVFLGVGISWTLGAIYWEMEGATPEWKQHSFGDGQTFGELYGGDYPAGGLIVRPGALAFATATYATEAFLCLGLLCVRRWRYGGELGGPRHAQLRDAAFLVFLWVVFIAATTVYASLT